VLNRLDDSAVHRDCLDAWARCDDFIAVQNKHPGSSFGQELVLYDGSVYYRREAEALELGKYVESSGKGDIDEILSLIVARNRRGMQAHSAIGEAYSMGIIDNE
jgi:hypothetical protein